MSDQNLRVDLGPDPYRYNLSRDLSHPTDGGEDLLPSYHPPPAKTPDGP